MAENLLLQPPEIVNVKGRVVFLGGPIQDAPDWQAEATEIIHGLDSKLVVASPRKDYELGTFVYERQVDWETHFLKRAAKFGAIMFWLAKRAQISSDRAYGQTSRFELGEWKREYQYRTPIIVVGIEEGFGNERYIKRRLAQDCPDIPILDNLEDTCKETVRELERAYG